MKKCLLGIVIALLVLSGVYAADFGAPEGKSVNVVFAPERNALEYMAAVTATGDQTAVDIGFRAKRQACVITTGGTAPLTVVVTGKRSVDGGSAYASVFTHTYTVATASTQTFDIDYVGRYWKFSYDSKTGGSTDTAITLKCDAKE